MTTSLIRLREKLTCAFNPYRYAHGKIKRNPKHPVRYKHEGACVLPEHDRFVKSPQALHGHQKPGHHYLVRSHGIGRSTGVWLSAYETQQVPVGKDLISPENGGADGDDVEVQKPVMRHFDGCYDVQGPC